MAVRYSINDKISVTGSVGRGFKAPDFRQLYLNFTNVAAGSYSVFGSLVAADEVERLTADGQMDFEQAEVFDVAGQLAVQELYGVLRSATAYIGNDSGPSHLAALSATTVLVIFGPTSNPDIWRPEGENVTISALPEETFWRKESASVVAMAYRELFRVR